jgi:hypothetical protein
MPRSRIILHEVICKLNLYKIINELKIYLIANVFFFILVDYGIT